MISECASNNLFRMIKKNPVIFKHIHEKISSILDGELEDIREKINSNKNYIVKVVGNMKETEDKINLVSIYNRIKRQLNLPIWYHSSYGNELREVLSGVVTF